MKLEQSTSAALGRHTILSRPVAHLFLIILAGVIVYANSLHVPFTLDDGSSITDNPVIRELGNFLGNGSGYAYNPRRYIGYLSFALNYRLGGLDVTGYHVANLAIHLVNAVLVYLLVRVTLRTPFFASGRPEETVRHAGPIALFTALLFVVHPVESQAVTYIVQRLTSLMTLFYLLALYLYARMRLAEEEGSARWRVAGLGLLGVAAAVLAMKTKENAFTLPVAALLYEWLFFRGTAGKRLLRLLPLLATMLIIPLSLLDIHKPVGDVISDVSEVTVVKAPLTRWEYLFTQFRVIVTYLRLLVLPVNQNLDYDYPLYRTLFAPPVLASLLLLLALFGLAVWLVYRSRGEAQGRLARLAAFGIFWFFLALAVESSIIPITDVIYEHRVYLPSVGAFLALATGAVLAAGRLGNGGRKAAAAGGALLLIVLGVATIQRNRVWSDRVTLWEDVVRKSPAKVRGYNNLGAALSDEGREVEAVAVLEKALAIKPDHPEAYYNLGRIYLQTEGRLGDAIALLTRAIELRPGYDDAYVNLAAAYIKGGNPARAVELLDSVTPAGRGRADRHFNLGVAYALLGERTRAEEEVAFLRGIDPAMAERLEQFVGRAPAGGGER